MISRFFRNLFKKLLHKQSILPTEECRRFLFNSGDCNTLIVKPSAFAPSNKSANTSVFLFSRFSSNDDFQRLQNKIVEARGRRLKGQAGFLAGDVERVKQELPNMDCDLQLILDEKEHLHHANIDNWPTAKEQKLFIQQALASRAILIK